MADTRSSEGRPAAAAGAGGWHRAAQGLGIVVVLVAVGTIGVAVGRSSAPGPTLVVVPGPVVQESPASVPLPDVGQASNDRLVVDDGWTSYPAVFTAAADLADSPTIASGYRLSVSGLDGADLAAGLASVLGVDGEVSRTGEGWQVGPGDDTGATLTVVDDAALSWSLVDPVAAAESSAGVFVDPGDARETAAGILAALGVDLETVEWQVDRYDTRLALTAWQLLDGARTSLAWTVGLGRDQAVVSASGFAASLVEVPGYPVVGAATAVRRAGLPTWSVIGPTPLIADPTSVPSSPPLPAPGAGEGGRPMLQVPVSGIVVTEAALGLAQFRQPDGALLVLPAYELTGDDGSRWTLIAVTGDYVDFVDQPFPSPAVPSP